jgi:hypothetical protein
MNYDYFCKKIIKHLKDRSPETQTLEGKKSKAIPVTGREGP